MRLAHAAEIDPAALRDFARRNAPQLERYFPATLRAGDDVRAARAHLAGHARRARERRGFLFFVVVGGCPGPAGLVAVTSIDPDAGHCEVSGMIGREWQGTGLMTRAMRCVLCWCRTELGLRRARLLIAPANVRSLALARRLGFRRKPRPGRPFREGTEWEETLDYYCRDLG